MTDTKQWTGPNIGRLPGLKAQARKEGWLDFVRTDADERALLEGCYFDRTAGERVCTFFRKFLRHSKGRWAGKPFEPLDWQRDDILFPIFGWKQENGLRRFQRAFIEISKKNGKSTCAAGIGLFMLLADGEKGAEVYSAACDLKQANIVHGEAVRMVEASAALSSALKINHSTNNIGHAASGSFYRAMSGEAQGKHGFNAHCIIIDELHEWHGTKLWDALKYAIISRDQPLIFVITTSGDDMLSVCRQQHEYAKDILRGVNTADLAFYACIYAADEKDDLSDPETWRKANPSMGHTMRESDFERDWTEAQKSPSAKASFNRLRLGIWQETAKVWLDPHLFPAGADPELSLDDLEGHTCYAGLDLSRTRDTSSFQLVFDDPIVEGGIVNLSWFWLPEETAFKLRGVVPYEAWAEAGWITLTPGSVIEFAFIEEKIGELSEQFRILEMAYDRAYATELAIRVQEQFDIERVEFPQTMAAFMGPTKEFERLLTAGRWRHPGNPCMVWQVNNTKVRPDANGNIRPRKPADQNDHRKIDGPVATIMCLGRKMAAAVEEKPSFGYDRPREERILWI